MNPAPNSCIIFLPLLLRYKSLHHMNPASNSCIIFLPLLLRYKSLHLMNPASNSYIIFLLLLLRYKSLHHMNPTSNRIWPDPIIRPINTNQNKPIGNMRFQESFITQYSIFNQSINSIYLEEMRSKENKYKKKIINQF